METVKPNTGKNVFHMKKFKDFVLHLNIGCSYATLSNTVFRIMFYSMKTRYKPAHDKPYIKTYATSKDIDQPAYLHSLISLC